MKTTPYAKSGATGTTSTTSGVKRVATKARRMSGVEAAVLKKEDSRLAVRRTGWRGGTRSERDGEETSRFLKQQIIFPIYEDVREEARQARDERDKLTEGDEGERGWGREGGGEGWNAEG